MFSTSIQLQQYSLRSLRVSVFSLGYTSPASVANLLLVARACFSEVFSGIRYPPLTHSSYRCLSSSHRYLQSHLAHWVLSFPHPFREFPFLKLFVSISVQSLPSLMPQIHSDARFLSSLQARLTCSTPHRRPASHPLLSTGLTSRRSDSGFPLLKARNKRRL